MKEQVEYDHNYAMLRHLIKSLSAMLNTITRQVDSAQQILELMEKRADSIKDFVVIKQEGDNNDEL